MVVSALPLALTDVMNAQEAQVRVSDDRKVFDATDQVERRSLAKCVDLPGFCFYASVSVD